MKELKEAICLTCGKTFSAPPETESRKGFLNCRCPHCTSGAVKENFPLGLEKGRKGKTNQSSCLVILFLFLFLGANAQQYNKYEVSQMVKPFISLRVSGSNPEEASEKMSVVREVVAKGGTEDIDVSVRTYLTEKDSLVFVLLGTGEKFDHPYFYDLGEGIYEVSLIVSKKNKEQRRIVFEAKPVGVAESKEFYLLDQYMDAYPEKLVIPSEYINLEEISKKHKFLFLNDVEGNFIIEPGKTTNNEDKRIAQEFLNDFYEWYFEKVFGDSFWKCFSDLF